MPILLAYKSFLNMLPTCTQKCSLSGPDFSYTETAEHVSAPRQFEMSSTLTAAHRTTVTEVVLNNIITQYAIPDE